MRRFLITSPKFSGTVELIYNQEELICCIDIRGASMPKQTLSHLKAAIPVTLEQLITGQGFGPDTMIVEAGFELDFPKFWEEYPLHRNRFKVEQVWNKMAKGDQVKAYFSLGAYKKYLQKNNWCSPMIADRYLRNKEYETDWVMI